MTNTPVLIPPDEKADLVRMAKEAGVPLGHALRVGARLFLEARLAQPPRRGRPRKESAGAA